MGNLMMDMNRTEAAVHHYKWASRIQPSNPELHYKLGGAFMAQNKHDHAIKSFLDALKIKPDYKQAHWKLQTSRRQRGKIIPSREEQRNKTGTATMRQKDYGRIITGFPESLKIKPDYKQTHWKLQSGAGKNN
jgi:tetratricopeptide (TPR) repeat protein